MYFMPRQSRMSYHVRGVTALPPGEEQHYQQHFTAKYFFRKYCIWFCIHFLYCNLYNKITICIFTVQVKTGCLYFTRPFSVENYKTYEAWHTTIFKNALVYSKVSIIRGYWGLKYIRLPKTQIKQKKEGKIWIFNTF